MHHHNNISLQQTRFLGTWKPITIEGDGALTASKFAGKPWLAKDEQWPNCPICQEPLQFFLQLNLNQLPEALQNEFGSGILQMFYCTNEFGCSPKYTRSAPKSEAFSDAHLIRIIHPEGKRKIVKSREVQHNVKIPKTQYFFHLN